MLSGGLDSSLITALMAEQSDRPGRRRSRSASPRTRTPTSSPTRGAVAQRLGTDHHELLTSAADHPELLDEALWHLEEPIADLSFLGFLLLSRLAREDVTVALSGQGADELLGGYRKHQIAPRRRPRSTAPRPLRRGGRWRRRAAERRDLDARARPARRRDRRRRRAAAAMSRVLQTAERRELLDPGVPSRGRRARARARSITRTAAGRGRSGRWRDAVPRHAARARRPHAPLLRQDVDGDVARGPRAVHGSRPRLVLHAAAGRRAGSLRGRRKELLRRVSRGLVDE